ncbi:MAG: tetratricopeptide repeat protein, partial [Planctomycetes bacterium]|nr:tetratricopeptide repeat protein [Planctomycetota bacterium]
RMELSRLGPKDLVRLLVDAFRSRHLAEELAGRIGEKSDGNPFFVFEIIRGLKEGQFIAQEDDGTWHTTKVIRDLMVPSSVLDLVKGRIAGLDAEDRDLLDVASCCGFSFDPTLVAEATGMARVAALKRLGQIERRHRLVRSAGRSMVFDHHQVQEALYGSLLDPLKEEYHGAIAGSLAARHPDPAGQVAVDLCDHWLKANKGEHALPFLDRAFDHLEKNWLNAPFVTLAERALAVAGLLAGSERVKVLLRLYGPLHRLGRRDRQRAACEEALALAREIGDRQSEAWAINDLGRFLYLVSRYAEAQKHYERAIAICREIAYRPGESQIAGNLGLVFCSLGRYAEARECLEPRLVFAREIGDRQGEAQVMGHLGRVFFCLGRYAEAKEHCERALAISRGIEDRLGEATGTFDLGNFFSIHGRYPEAKEHFECALAISREIGDRRGEACALGNLGMTLSDFGRCAEARNHYQLYFALAREIADRSSEAIAKVNLGSVSRFLGRCAEAREHSERSLAIAREIGDRRVEGYALASLGYLADAEGDPDGARLRHGEALALRRALGAKNEVAATLAALGDLERRAGEAERAAALLDEALAIGRETGSPELLVPAAASRSLLPGGDIAAALAAFREHGERIPHMARMAARFLLFEATGDPTHLAEAKRLLDFAVEHAPEDCRESMLRNVRLHREIMAAAKEEGL